MLDVASRWALGGAGRRLAWARRIFGPLADSYVVHPAGDGSSRLTVKLCAGAGGAVNRARAALLAWGHLVMMRKHLLSSPARGWAPVCQ